MKNLIGFLGMMGFSNLALAASVPFACTVDYTLPNGSAPEFQYNSSTSGANEGLIDADVAYFGGTANLHVSYDGEYSSINFYDKASGTYYNSDSEVARGKLFSLHVQSPKSPIVTDLTIACTSK